MSIATWNISGLQAPNRVRAVAHYLKGHPCPPIIIGLIETRGQIQQHNYYNYKLIGSAPNNGLSGGISILAKSFAQVSKFKVHNRRMVSLQICLHKKNYNIVIIYGAHVDAENTAIVKALAPFMKRKRVIIIGDMNKLNIDLGSKFVDGFLDCGIGDDYTWERTVNGVVQRSRIDKVWSNCNGTTVHEDFFTWKLNPVRFTDHKMIRYMIDDPSNKPEGCTKRWIFPNYILESPSVCKWIKDLLIRNRYSKWQHTIKELRNYMAYLMHLSVIDGVERKHSLKKLQEQVTRSKGFRAGPETTKLMKCCLQQQNGKLDSSKAFEHFSHMYSDSSTNFTLSVPIELFNIRLEDVTTIIKQLHTGSPGPSGITVEFIKLFSNELAPILCDEYNDWLCTGYANDWWKKTIISMIPKANGDLSQIENWRGICLLNYEYKIFTKFVDSWLRAECYSRSIISQEQIGFINRRWMQRNTLIVQSFLQDDVLFNFFNDINQPYKGCAFLDIKNAYPSIRFTWFLKQMDRHWGEQGVALGKLLIGGHGMVSLNNWLTKSFPICRGVKQGDCAAPICFNIAFQPILDELLNKLKGAPLWDLLLKCLAFADDVVIFFNTIRDIQFVRRVFERWKLTTGLELNDNKTKILWSQNSIPITLDKWNNVNEFNYLGATIKRNGQINLQPLFAKFEERLKNVHKLNRLSSSTLFLCSMVNVYCISTFYHVLRCDCDPGPYSNQYRKLIRQYLGPQGRPVWDRLSAPVDLGGYGCIDLQRKAIEMKIKWSLYLSEYNDPFALKFYHQWLKNGSNTCLKSLSSIYFNNTKPPKFNLLNTSAQDEWLLLGYNWRDEWKTILKLNTLKKVKYWWLDNLNIHLRVAYKTVQCGVCKEFIGSKHFISECSGIKKIEKYKKKQGHTWSTYVSWWICWIWHCKNLHSDTDQFPKVFNKCTKDLLVKQICF